MPRRRRVEIPPLKDAFEPPRMHVLFDVMAAYNVSDPYVEHFLGDPKIAESYGLMSLIGVSGSRSGASQRGRRIPTTAGPISSR